MPRLDSVSQRCEAAQAPVDTREYGEEPHSDEKQSEPEVKVQRAALSQHIVRHGTR